MQMAAKEIMSYVHQPWTFLIVGHKLKYTPDFLVVYTDCFEIHEVKAGILDKNTGKHVPHYKNATQRGTIKMCASMFPWFKFKVFWYWGKRYEHQGWREIKP